MSALQKFQFCAKRSISSLRAETNTPTWNYFKNRSTSLVDSSNKRTPEKVDTKNYYKILGIGERASLRDVKHAFYNLAKLYHPDATKVENAEANLKFQKISEAYEVLSDESKRYEYDRYGMVRLRSSGITTRLPFRFDEQSNVRGKEADNENKDLMISAKNEIIIPITFLQSVHGTNREINVPLKVPCKTCKNNKGTGTSTQVVACAHCKGSGVQSMGERTAVCASCNGARYSLNQMCRKCGGHGTVVSRSRITVHIPPGVQNNDILRLPYPGMAKPTANKEINVKLKIESHDKFKRHDLDILSEIEIPFTTAVLGGSVLVQTVHDHTAITIPAGTHSHTLFRIQGKGVKKNRLAYGDHVVTVKVRTPTKLSSQQRSLLMAYLESNDCEPNGITKQISKSIAAKSSSLSSSSAFRNLWKKANSVKRSWSER